MPTKARKPPPDRRFVEADMQKPKMILFDYGHTLALEPEQDYLRGHRRVIELAAENPLGITPEELHGYSQKLYSELFAQLRPLDLETDGLKLDACIYDTLRLKFDRPLEEIELERWRATEPIFPMEGVENFLELCAEQGVRMAVISNLSFSGDALVKRIGEILPEHIGLFEFILASSESVYRKPSRHIFERALSLAGLEAGECWFTGDDVVCDIEGAAGAGIFPVWFRAPIRCTYKKPADHEPQCEHLTVSSWAEFGDLLRAL